MTFSVDDARATARSLVSQMHPRWLHVQSVGRQAEELATRVDLPERVVVACWLHDIGYSPEIAQTGFHPLDGAQFLNEQGAPRDVVRLVAWHTGAGYEAAQRGLLEQLEHIAQPDIRDLDALTMIDLATSPHGEPVRDVDRIAEILERYDEGQPVHEAVSLSRSSLLASSSRAKAALGLPQDWPVCC